MLRWWQWIGSGRPLSLCKNRYHEIHRTWTPEPLMHRYETGDDDDDVQHDIQDGDEQMNDEAYVAGVVVVVVVVVVDPWIVVAVWSHAFPACNFDTMTL